MFRGQTRGGIEEQPALIVGVGAKLPLAEKLVEVDTADVLRRFVPCIAFTFPTTIATTIASTTRGSGAAKESKS